VSNLVSGIFIGVGSPSCEFMCCTMDVRVFVFVEIGQAIDDYLRLLSRCRIVEPYYRIAVYLFVEDRESGANRGDIELAANRPKIRQQRRLELARLRRRRSIHDRLRHSAGVFEEVERWGGGQRKPGEVIVRQRREFWNIWQRSFETRKCKIELRQWHTERGRGY
jgi:hypothetical protein